MLGKMRLIGLALSSLAFCASATFHSVQKTHDGGTTFGLDSTTYFANTAYPATALNVDAKGLDWDAPITIIHTNASNITAAVMRLTLESYVTGDDVFSMAFTPMVMIKSPAAAIVHSSAMDYLAGIKTTHVMTKNGCVVSPHGGVKSTSWSGAVDMPPGPYFASSKDGVISLAKVYRLYEDTHRDFLYGAYALEDGTGRFASLGISIPQFSYSAIPVPSRIYSWADSRPFAGYRVAIKDLFDMKGLVTTGGSQAWALINPPANATAPSIQRILDLGGVLVGKYKLAQFASGANPWDWQDEHYPFNPRGDGWLTCSASSSGGGCSIAAYDWLDFAIGSDTGSSMRRPAAVSGTYGQRPSQGMISLERVLPLGGATDTAGVFSRDPYKWIHFSKHWYIPSLHQSPNLTGLSPLVVPDSNAFPKTILYPTDYLPLNNSAAEPILDTFIGNMSSLFGMTVKRFNFSATVANASNAAVANLTELSSGPLGVINSRTQWVEVAKPLITQWGDIFDGRFPPIDPARREGWYTYNETENSLEAYNEALRRKNAAVEWYENNLQYSTPESCSESVMLYDIGTGGLPSYREEELNNSPNASFLAVRPKGATITGASICPLYGCADFTIPIGQVPYWSNVTYHTEMVPVTINMVVKRGCDFVLYNMIERLADAGVLKTVKTGRTAF